MAITIIEESPLLVVFGCTLLMLVIHPLEWFKIRCYRQTAPGGLNIAGMLAFDILELVFLVFLISEFWPLIGITL